MSTRSYRLVLVGCMLSWFLLGMHTPLLHQFTAHGRAPHAGILAVLAVLAAGAVAGLWALLRAPGRGAT
jgi:hypothetical protein